PKDRLYATVFEGDRQDGLSADDEAAELWRKTTDIDPSHIRRFGQEDNFWAPGDTGPCGPCSEIHYDNTDDLSGAKLVNAGDPRVVEVWNLVFIQFNRDATGRLEPLPAKHVDTGMGFERVCRILNGKASNYATDLFVPIIQKLETLTAHRYGATSRLADRFDVTSENDIADVACRVVADHARCLTFAIADGVLPSNEGRGYVLRRILRRAARYARQYLKIDGPFLTQLTPTVVELMGGAFPEVRARQKVITDTIAEEEESFGKTLDNGIKTWWSYAGSALWGRFHEEQSNKPRDKRLMMVVSSAAFAEGDRELDLYREKKIPFYRPDDTIAIAGLYGPDAGKTFDRFQLQDLTPDKMRSLCQVPPEIKGEHVFELHATYGFPPDLTALMGAERGMTVDLAGYEHQMAKHREISSAGSDKFKVTAVANLPATDDSAKYHPKAITAKVLGWVVGDQYVTTGELQAGDEAAVVLDRTNFYGEQGGQLGDSGSLTWPGGRFAVRDAVLPGQCVLHVGKMEQGKLRPGREIAAEVLPSRFDTMRNHTATHLLNWALRRVLGDHVEQAGSEVGPDRLRFDFTHGQAVSTEQLAEAERLVNRRVLADEKVVCKTIPLAQARKIPGVRAVFGEKYPDPVRVVCVGSDDPLAAVDEATAAEFCGGTHLERTSQVGLFKIISEESVAKGVRRITAVTGPAAVGCVQEMDAAVRAISSLLRAPVGELAARVESLQKELKELRKRPAKGAGAAEDFQAQFTLDCPRGQVLVGQVSTADPAAMRQACDRLRQKGACAVFVGGTDGDKVTLIAMVDQALAAEGKCSASEWVKAVAPVVGGSGGGKATLAQAGGKDGGKLSAALAAAADWIKTRLA
ncbi:MAG: alanine--tRNA ligase-related protein, partial [Phycisphaerae bacterium]|nr:alanine--tRNA ligase-related protein [Phycisphaerae bacterium]